MPYSWSVPNFMSPSLSIPLFLSIVIQEKHGGCCTNFSRYYSATILVIFWVHVITLCNYRYNDSSGPLNIKVNPLSFNPMYFRSWLAGCYGRRVCSLLRKYCCNFTMDNYLHGHQSEGIIAVQNIKQQFKSENKFSYINKKCLWLQRWIQMA